MGKNDDKNDKFSETVKSVSLYIGTGFLMSYVTIAFVVCDLNFINWYGGTRFILVVSSIIVAAIVNGMVKGEL